MAIMFAVAVAILLYCFTNIIPLWVYLVVIPIMALAIFRITYYAYEEIDNPLGDEYNN